MVRRALEVQCREGLVLQQLTQAPRQPRLADARLAGQEDHSAAAGLRLPPAIEEQLHLRHASDQRRQPGCLARRKAAFHAAARPQHSPGRHRCPESLEVVGAEVGKLEQVANQPPGARADHDRPGVRQGLQPRGEIGRLADHGLLPRRTLADELADDARPVAMPTLAASGSPPGVRSPATAWTIAKPARTARSGSSSCALGQPK